MKRTGIVILAVLLTAGVASAVQGPHRGRPGGGAFGTDQIKAYLGLSDQQLQDLANVQTALRETAAPLVQQIREKVKALSEALHQDPVDSALVSQLKADLAALRDQESALRAQYRVHAQNVLSAEQKSKLEALQQVLQLMTAAREATGLNLLDAPEGPPPGPPGFGVGPEAGSRGMYARRPPIE